MATGFGHENGYSRFLIEGFYGHNVSCKSWQGSCFGAICLSTRNAKNEGDIEVDVLKWTKLVLQVLL